MPDVHEMMRAGLQRFINEHPELAAPAIPAAFAAYCKANPLMGDLALRAGADFIWSSVCADKVILDGNALRGLTLGDMTAARARIIARDAKPGTNGTEHYSEAEQRKALAFDLGAWQKAHAA